MNDGDRDSSGGHPPELEKMLRELRSMGYDLDSADGTVELLAHQAAGVPTEFFRLEEFRVSIEKGFSGPALSHAELTLHVAGRSYSSSANDPGPVHAIDDCLRKTLAAFYPMVRAVQIHDYKVRVLGTQRGAASRVQVDVESTDGISTWTTAGVSENILEASWQALADSYRLWLVRESLRHPHVGQHATEDYCWGV
jgi:2-isopropylmalate synthase